MRSVVGNFEEERLLRVSLDETYRSFGDQIGHVSADLYRGVVFVQVRLSVQAGVLVVVDAAAQKPEEGVEAVSARSKLRRVAEVPFADQTSRVAVVLQQLRE